MDPSSPDRTGDGTSAGAPAPSGPSEPSGPSAPTPTDRGRWKVVVAIVVVLVVGAGAWFVFGGERAEQSSEDQARQRLATAPSFTVAPGASAPSSTGLSSTSSSSTGTGGGPTTSAAPPRLTTTPAPGLYRYAGSGKENTSFPPLTEEQGPQMPATVSDAGGGCWLLRVDYNTHHWQSWTMCTIDGTLTERNGTSYAKRNFGGLDIENTSQFVCDPPTVVLEPGEGAGAEQPRSCAGSGNLVPATTVAAGKRTIVGEETVDVGGMPVPTIHVRYDLTYAGGQSGTEVTDWWFVRDTGLPARNTHRIEVVTDTPFGRITYTENAEFGLVSAGPV